LKSANIVLKGKQQVELLCEEAPVAPPGGIAGAHAYKPDQYRDRVHLLSQRDG